MYILPSGTPDPTKSLLTQETTDQKMYMYRLKRVLHCNTTIASMQHDHNDITVTVQIAACWYKKASIYRQ